MNTYAVAVINFYDNENDVVIVKANNEIEAIALAVNFESEDDVNYTNWVNEIVENCKTVEEAKQYLFDGDIGVSSPVKI